MSERFNSSANKQTTNQQGINARMKSLLTKRIKIPMAENVDSLNVAVAASFIGYVKHFRAASTAALAFRPGVRGGTQTKK